MDQRERLVTQLLGGFESSEVHHFPADAQIQQVALSFPASAQNTGTAHHERVAGLYLDPVIALARLEFPAQGDMHDHVMVRRAEGGSLAGGLAIPAQEAQIDTADARMRLAEADEPAGAGNGERTASGGEVQDPLAGRQDIGGGKMLAP